MESHLSGSAGASASEPTDFTRTSDDGFWVRHHFCPRCATRLFYVIEQRSGMISIPTGALADPDFPAPTIEVYEIHLRSWLPESTALLLTCVPLIAGVAQIYLAPLSHNWY